MFFWSHHMNPFEMVVLIVAIVTVGRIIAAKNGWDFGRRGRRYRDRDGGYDPQMAAENDRLRSEMTQLKERIATLERLAVDKRSRLADEIDALK
jgi:hypothetical protein